jgi:hypothetical protein
MQGPDEDRIDCLDVYRWNDLSAKHPFPLHFAEQLSYDAD